MTEVLVVANQTLGGAKLLDAVRARAKDGATFRLVVPLTRPSAALDRKCPLVQSRVRRRPGREHRKVVGPILPRR